MRESDICLSEKGNFLLNLTEVNGKKSLVNYKDADIYFVDTARIFRNPSVKPPPREKIDAMSEEIARFGMTTPLILRGDENAIPHAAFEIADGHCRAEAAHMLEMPMLPAIIIPADGVLREELRLIARLCEPEASDMFIRAEIYGELLMLSGINYTQGRLAKRLGISQSNVANRLRLLHMTAAEREAIREAGLTERHARAILRIQSSKTRLAALEEAAARKLSVAETEALVENIIRYGSVTEAVRNAQLQQSELGMFYDAIERAVRTLKKSGVGAKTERYESNGDVDVWIKLRK